MAVFALIFKDLFRPIYYVASMLQWCYRFRHESMLFTSSAVFVFVVFISCSLGRVNSVYYRYIHRGIWEDVIIGLPYDVDLPSPKDMVVRLGIKKETGHGEAEHASFEELEESFNSLLGGNVKYFVAGKRLMTSVRFDAVEIGGKDVSRIHGQFDVWIKSSFFEVGQSGVNTTIPRGSVLLSRSLAQKLNPRLVEETSEAVIRFGRWERFYPLHAFNILGSVDAGGLSVIYMNKQDLPKLGLSAKYNFAGINLESMEPADAKDLVSGRLGPAYLVRTSSEIEDTRLIRVFMITINLAIVLLAMVIATNEWFSTLHSFEMRRKAAYLLTFYGYGQTRGGTLFAFMNMVPALSGICISLASIFTGWPIPLSRMLLGPLQQMDFTLGMWDLAANPLFIGVVIGLLLYHFAIGFILFFLRGSSEVDGVC